MPRNAGSTESPQTWKLCLTSVVHRQRSSRFRGSEIEGVGEGAEILNLRLSQCS